ncbi:MAG TPA: DUF4070 domain-containing protein, partial [Vampirovibrionales bacterium]
RRCFQQCLNIVPHRGRKQNMHFPTGKGLGLVARLIWHQGIRRPEIRGQFWQQLWTLWRTQPQVINLYLGLCAAGEHFWEYRVLARTRLTEQLSFDPMMVEIQSGESKEDLLKVA